MTVDATVLPDNLVEALNILDEAIGFFQRCFELQEHQFSQAESQPRLIDSASMPVDDQEQLVPPHSPISDASEREQWVSIEQPPDEGTLLDTSIALIEALTDVCALLPSQSNPWLPKIEELSQKLLEGKISTIARKQDQILEVALAKANLLSGYADASFRAGDIDLHAYEEAVRTAFGNDLDLSHSPKGLCDRAEAIQLLSSSMRSLTFEEPLARRSEKQWNYLSEALSDLKAASALPDAKNLAKIHLKRGDCELLRYRLGQVLPVYRVAQTHAATLLKNAEVYYRGAFNSAKAENLQGEGLEAAVKEAVVIAKEGAMERLCNLFKTATHAVCRVLEEMKDEALISDEDFNRLWTQLGPAFATDQE